MQQGSETLPFTRQQQSEATRVLHSQPQEYTSTSYRDELAAKNDESKTALISVLLAYIKLLSINEINLTV